MQYTDQEIDDLLQKVYSGEISLEALPRDLYARIAEHLISGLGEIEGKLSENLLAELSENLRYFSASKVWQQIKDMTLVKDNQDLKSFAEFKDEALQIFDQYNKNWLRAEYDTTIGQAQMCERWEQIDKQKETLPFLRYSAVIDSQTSEICEPLDGITLPVDDPFWDSNSPLNHFNCRCTLEQVDEFDAVVTDQGKADEVGKQMDEVRQPLFNSNSYRTKEVFDESHPYFDLTKEGAKAVDDLVNGE